MKNKLFLITLFLLLLGVSKTKAQYHITSVTRIDTFPHPYCDTAEFLISTDITCSVCSLFYALVDYGDGTISSYNFFDTSGNNIVSHVYDFPGVYTAKFVLIVDSSGFGGGPYTPTADDSVITTVNNASNCYTLPIQIFYDAASSGTYAGNPLNILPITIEVSKNSIPIDTISCTSGLYFGASGDVGDTYAFKIISLPADMTVSSPSATIIYDTINSYSSTYPVKYFGLSCSGTTGFDLTVVPVFESTAVHHQLADIYVSNLSCNPVNATLTVNFSPKYTFVGGIPTPASVVGNIITWALTGVSSNTSPIGIYYEVVDSSGDLAVGDTVQEEVSVTPTAGDFNPSNNYVSVIDTVKSSFDPNEMSVNPSGFISAGTKLQYTINFENTGNDTAFNISVYDTLSDDVDVKSLTIIMASAAMNIAIMNVGGHNIAKFDFPNINLLDSSHHGLCNGAVVFTINSKTGLAAGTTIYNEAGIYFDYNPVVMTNTVEDIIGFPSGTPTVMKNNNASVFPNPTNDAITININDEAYSRLTITNVIGQVMLQQQVNGKQTNVSMSSLQPGIYFITLRGDAGIKVIKVEKI